MKIVKIVLTSVSSSDNWANLAHELWFDKFKKKNSNLDQDELADKFYNEVVRMKFSYGEYANMEIEVNEKLEIVGGRIF